MGTLTLSDDDASRSRAQDLLGDADSKLAKIDRARLSSEDSSAYSQAAGLVQAARQALKDHDYLAAAGLAKKASLISSQLTARKSSQ